MAIAVSVQIELVGEHPLLEVHSLIFETIIKAPTITDVVPNKTFHAVLEYGSKQLALMALSSGIEKDVLEPVTATFGGELASDWQFNAAKQDFYLESCIQDDKGNNRWLITIEIVANCELEREDDDEVPVTLTKIPSNLH